MADSKQILAAFLKEDLIEAKKLINEALLEKLGTALEDKLVDFAPTVFNEASKGLHGKQDKLDANKNGKIDAQDFKLLKKKKKTNESTDSDEELNAIVEQFESEVNSIVQEIQEETGEMLSEEEIADIANEYLDALTEGEKKHKKKKDEEDSEEDDSDEEEDKETE